MLIWLIHATISQSASEYWPIRMEKDTDCLIIWIIHLTIIQHWATWWTPWIVLPAWKKFSCSGKPAKRWRSTAVPAEWKSWRRSWYMWNIWWNFNSVKESARNEHPVGLYQLQDGHFPGVGCQLQCSEYPLDISLGPTDSSIHILTTVFHWETLTWTYIKHHRWLERLQSPSQLPATCNLLPESHSVQQKRRA